MGISPHFLKCLMTFVTSWHLTFKTLVSDVLRCYSVAVPKQLLPKSQKQTLYLYIIIYKYRSIFRVWGKHFENCNTVTLQQTVTKIRPQKFFFEKKWQNIREPQWECCNFALGIQVVGVGWWVLAVALYPLPSNHEPLTPSYSTVPSPFQIRCKSVP